MKQILIAVATVIPALHAAPIEPKFRPVNVDTNIAIGYGVTVADVDGDKKPDIVLCDAKQIVWYSNPGWEKHVIAENLTKLDHVCIAAQDIDGDGKAEIAVGAGWNPGDTVNSGALFFLQAPADRTQRWEPIALPHEPTMHRIRWTKDAKKGWALVSVPLHGRGNKDAKGDGVRIQRYFPSKDLKSPWTVETISDRLHKTHNFDPRPGSDGAVEKILVGAAEGAFLLDSSAGNGAFQATQIGSDENGGVGEIRALGDAGGGIAAISPMHGNQLVVFRPPAPGGGGSLYQRTVIDENLADGHALACGDLLGLGTSQIVAGWRAMGRPRSVKVGVAVYIPAGERWIKVLVDDDQMACEDLCLADLDGDGRLDIVASGRATKNVKVYFNELAK
jgi:hypothetical protein